MVLGEIITDADTNFATLATVHSHKGCLCGIVVKDGIRFRTILGAEATGCFAADGLIDMRNKIQGISPLV